MNSTGNMLAFFSSLATAFYVWETGIAGKVEKSIITQLFDAV